MAAAQDVWGTAVTAAAAPKALPSAEAMGMALSVARENMLAALARPEEDATLDANTVLVSFEELSVLLEIANDRMTRNRMAGVVDRRRATGLNPLDIDFQGVIAEYAAMLCTGADITPLFDTTPRCAAKDYHADLRLPTPADAPEGTLGASIDVKSCFVKSTARDLGNYRLWVDAKKARTPADYYMMVGLSEPVVYDGENRVEVRYDSVAQSIAARAAHGGAEDVGVVATMLGHGKAEFVFGHSPVNGVHTIMVYELTPGAPAYMPLPKPIGAVQSSEGPMLLP
jgi:hypothetical protein